MSSIREFLVLEAPIILFDAKMDFVVVTLEQVRLAAFSCFFLSVAQPKQELSTPY